jgi:hypothetical protein
MSDELKDEPVYPPVTLRDLLLVREDIYTHFQDSKSCDDYFICEEENLDKYAAYYTSMYLLQDTAESLICHRDTGFSSDPFKAYIEFWGVMQALIIQQDALKELHSVFFDEEDWPMESEAWREIRKLRNQCAGHPVRQGKDSESIKRAFMGRNFGTYEAITFEQWTKGTRKISHTTFDLGNLIDRYVANAKDLLEDILVEMKRRWS